MLGVMICSLKGGPKYLSKLQPFNGLSTKFLHKSIDTTLDALKSCSVKPIAIICDGNRTNQSYFDLLRKSDEEYWVSKDGVFLIYDFVHIIKCIRNNWVVQDEKILAYPILDDDGNPIFGDDGKITKKLAYWSVILELHHLEIVIYRVKNGQNRTFSENRGKCYFTPGSPPKVPQKGKMF